MTESRIERLLDEEELARLAERARLDVHDGVRGETRPAGVEVDDEEEHAAHGREHARFVRGLTGLRCAAGMYAVRRDARGLTPVVWGTWALHAGRFDPYLFPERSIAAAVKSVGPRVLDVPGLAERLAGSSAAVVRRALAGALPAESRRALASHPRP